jgi:hypothetical protein
VRLAGGRVHADDDPDRPEPTTPSPLAVRDR